ncbi:hypothetical protein S40293_01691 [Stachybotrys chartarum IBT 40293]|nr:hypothetical protein S40293_01691 [Stachybotrys chartarum IBT 40293]
MPAQERPGSNTSAERGAYRHKPLGDGEIRLVTICPAEPHDQLHVRISHLHLPQWVHTDPAPRPLSLGQLRETLPPGWWVYETTEDRIYFYYEEAGGSNWKTSWRHPVPGFDESLYARPSLPIRDVPPCAQFEALSYTWGNAGRHQDAVVYDGQDSDPAGVVALNLNLSNALHHLRSPSKARTLWIDALCINQFDDVEKARQLPRMADIYRHAAHVVVWLGPERDNSSLAMDTLAHLGSQIQTTTDHWLFSTPGAQHPFWCESSCPLPYADGTWAAVAALLSRAWFSRVWIVQEVQLGRENAVVSCGGREMAWSTFCRAITCLWSKDRLHPILPRSKVAFVERLTNPGLRLAPLSNIIRLAHGRECMNPRDRIYGLLALFLPSFQRLLVPAYTDSVAEVYKDVTLQYIRHAKRLELLRACQLQGRKIGLSELPSWIPDYSAQAAQTHYADYNFASAGSACHVRLVDHHSLLVTGRRCATISQVTSSLSALEAVNITNRNGEAPASDSSRPKNDETAVDLEGTYVTGEEMRVALCKTLVGNYLREQFPDDSIPSLDEWLGRLIDGSAVQSFKDRKYQRDHSDSFHNDYVWDFLRLRCFTQTHEGYIGDAICVLLGCESPIVLRQTTSGRYHVVGEAYVHGLQDGQAFLGPLEEQWSVHAVINNSNRQASCRFTNTNTAEIVDHDPRLPPLPEQWELSSDNTHGDPATTRTFNHKSTGLKLNSDPRLTPGALKSRRVSLEEFVLV